MKRVAVARVRFDDVGRLHVLPASNLSQIFRYVYRAAMEVNWDEEEQGFYTPVPRDLTYADWYSMVVSAVQSEMGVALELNDATIWENVPPAIEAQIRQRFPLKDAYGDGRDRTQ